MNFPIGISDFEEIVQGDYYFIDKTLLIKEIMDDGAKIILLTRPRRFGKTLNLSMLYYFLSEDYYNKVDQNLFEGLSISKEIEFCKKHQGQYPVIFISFKDIKEDTFTKAYAGIVVLISALYEKHRYLLEGDLLSESQKNIFTTILNQKADEANIKVSIQNLAEYLTKKFKQFPIILIDEYDTPIQQAYLKEYYGDMISLMRGILGSALKDNKPNERFLEKAIITGITRIGQESIFSGLNNFEVYSVLEEKYGQYFGFIEEEVLKLIDDSQQTLELAPIKEWYNGYQIDKYTLYNPWSIIKCLKNKGTLEWYWVNTSSNDLIAELLTDADIIIKLQFEQLLQGEIIERPISKNFIFPEIKKSEEALWSLLLYAGYLKVLSTQRTEYQMLAQLAVPNREIRFVYNKIIAQWFTIKSSMDSYRKFIESLLSGDVSAFKHQLSNYIIQTGSYFDFNKHTPEEVFHIFILGLVVGLKDEYIIQFNRESGIGRLDVIFLPKNNKRQGILIEFKTGENPDLLLTRAEEALEQIKNKHYLGTFKQHNVRFILAIGLAFCGKQLELAHENISI